MSPERWKRIKNILEATLEKRPDERERFLDEVCASDPELRKEVDSLLSGQAEAEDYLESPPVSGMGTFRASGGLEGSRAASPDPPLMMGRRLAHYKILDKIGSGGMGDVYVAEDTELGRKVALKVLPAQMAESEGRRTRFKREARAIAALNHPNIVTVYSVEQANDVHFMTMELVRGQRLSELQPKDGFALGKFFDFAIPLADAVAAVHQEGITHRDLKPDNVMVSHDGRVKVLDFGIVKSRAGLAWSSKDIDLPTEGMTREGRVLGTLSYMSPEQADGKPVDERSDIFSLGIVLYEMVTGQHPFRGDTPASTLSAIIKDTPDSASDIRPSIPQDLAKMLRRCLVKDPARRLQTCMDVRNELEEIKEALSSDALEARTVVSGPSRWWLFATGVFFVATGVILGVLLWSSGRAPGSRVPWLTNPVQVTSAIWVENNPTWSPEGGRIAYESDQGGNWDIWVTHASVGPAVNLTQDSAWDDFGPSWSPDGSQIAFKSNREGGGCFVMSALGGTPWPLVSPPGISWGRPAWSSDGSKLACPGRDEQSRRIIDIVTLATREVARLPLGTQYDAMDVSWSPDGRFLAYVDAFDMTATTTQLWIVSLSGESIALTGGTTEVWSPAWSADGKSLFYVSNRGGSKDLWIQELNKDGTPQGDSEPVTTGLGIQSVSFRGDGTQIAYSKGGRFGNLWRVPILSDRVAMWPDAQQLTFDQALVEFVDVSPDGHRLVVNSNRSGFYDLWLLSVDGGEMQPLTSDTAADDDASWSPDGREIAFYTRRTGNRDIFVMPTDGGPMRQLTTHAGADAHPVWSPDGMRVAYMSVRDGNYDIWVTTPTGGEHVRLTEHHEVDNHPAFSPDGRWIAFDSLRVAAGPHIWRVRADGGEAERLTERQGQVPRWAPDGEKIYFLTLDRDEIWELILADRTERLVAALSGRPGTRGDYALAADGKYLYFTWEETIGDIWIMDVMTEQ